MSVSNEGGRKWWTIIVCMCACLGVGGGGVVRKKCVGVCVPVREFEGRVSPSLLWRLLNGSCAPGAGSA